LCNVQVDWQIDVSIFFERLPTQKIILFDAQATDLVCSELEVSRILRTYLSALILVQAIVYLLLDGVENELRRLLLLWFRFIHHNVFFEVLNFSFRLIFCSPLLWRVDVLY